MKKLKKLIIVLILLDLDKINLKNAIRTQWWYEEKSWDSQGHLLMIQKYFILCDEPNSGLDPLTAIKIDDLILELTQKLNTTTIVVTHDMNSVIEIGEYIMFLHNGKKIWEGNNKEILKTKIKELNDFVFSNKLMKKIRRSLVPAREATLFLILFFFSISLIFFLLL